MSRFLVYAMCLTAIPIITQRADAGDHHREHPMPPAGSGCSITLHPGEQVQIDASFTADWESCVQVYHQPTGRLLAVWNNYDGGGGSWLSPKNTSSQDQVLLVVGRHKAGQPDAYLPWQLSHGTIVSEAAESRTFGFDDSFGDEDYDDAQASVTWVK